MEDLLSAKYLRTLGMNRHHVHTVLEWEVLCTSDTAISWDIHTRFSLSNVKTQLSVTCHFKILADKKTDVTFVRRKHPELIPYPISKLQVFVLKKKLSFVFTCSQKQVQTREIFVPFGSENLFMFYSNTLNPCTANFNTQGPFQNFQTLRALQTNGLSESLSQGKFILY